MSVRYALYAPVVLIEGLQKAARAGERGYFTIMAYGDYRLIRRSDPDNRKRAADG
jgi:hypothetical protein